METIKQYLSDFFNKNNYNIFLSINNQIEKNQIIIHLTSLWTKITKAHKNHNIYFHFSGFYNEDTKKLSFELIAEDRFSGGKLHKNSKMKKELVLNKDELVEYLEELIKDHEIFIEGYQPLKNLYINGVLDI